MARFIELGPIYCKRPPTPGKGDAVTGTGVPTAISNDKGLNFFCARTAVVENNNIIINKAGIVDFDFINLKNTLIRSFKENLRYLVNNKCKRIYDIKQHLTDQIVF